MEASVNVPRILQVMAARQLRIVDVCRLCHVNNKTLAKMLRGEIPRLDAVFRLLNGLEIPLQEVLIAPTHKKAAGSRLYVVPDRRKLQQVAADKE
jgi:hypothetical protein